MSGGSVVVAEEGLARNTTLAGGGRQIVTDFGVAGMSLGTCLVYRTDKFPNVGPESWADFWDVRKFPGTRSLFRVRVRS